MAVAEVVVKGKLVGAKEDIAERAVKNKKVRTSLFMALAGENRSQRILAARSVHTIAIHDPEALKEYGSEMTDALDRPEAQTRWEILGAFEKMVVVDARMVGQSIPPATAALHDEESGVVRLAAFRLLAAFGATTETRSDRVWPLIDEAIRVYHGDPEFPQMLSSVYRLVIGESSEKVKLEAAERMLFDSEHGKGLLAKRAKQIVSCAPQKWHKKRAEEVAKALAEEKEKEKEQ